MLNRALIAVGALWGVLVWAPPSKAVPPGNWSVGVERLFGASRVTSHYVVTDTEVKETSRSWFSSPAPHEGYSSPRLAFDYLMPFGLSVGGALGYHQITEVPGGEYARKSRALVLAPRAGYFFQFAPWFGLWPRAGVTRLWLKDRGRENETAITLELPVLWLFAGGQLGIVLTPYLDIGLHSGSTDLSEQGLQAGATAFF